MTRGRAWRHADLRSCDTSPATAVNHLFCPMRKWTHYRRHSPCKAATRSPTSSGFAWLRVFRLPSGKIGQTCAGPADVVPLFFRPDYCLHNTLLVSSMPGGPRMAQNHSLDECAKTPSHRGTCFRFSSKNLAPSEDAESRKQHKRFEPTSI
jgi:hypothetical protein